MENSPAGLPSNTSPVFGTFSPPASANKPQNLFSQLSQSQSSSSGGTTPLFGQSISTGMSSSFGSTGPNVFGSQNAFGGSSAPLFGKSQGLPTFGSQGSTQSSFQSSVAKRTPVFGSTGQASSFPSSNLFTSSTSGPSQKLFGKNVQTTASFGPTQAPTSAAPGGVNTIPANLSFKAPSENPFGRVPPSSSPAMLFDSGKPSAVFSGTSTVTSSSSNYLFGKNVGATSQPSQTSTAMLTTQDSSTLGTQNKNPFGGGTVSTPSAMLFGGTKPKQSEARPPMISSTTLFGKPVQGAALFTGSKMGQTSTQVFSSKTDSASKVDNNRTLFGKPLSQNMSFGEQTKGSSTFSDTKVKASGEVPTFPSQSGSASIQGSTSVFSQMPKHKDVDDEVPKALLSQPSGTSASPQSNRSREREDTTFTEQRQSAGPLQTSVAGARLFEKALPIKKSPPEREGHASAEEVSANKSPRRSLNKWSSNRETFAGLKRKGRLFSSTQSKPGATALSRRMSREPVTHKSLAVKNIPDQYNDEKILRNHFSQFGNISRFRLTAPRNMLSLTFETSDSAVKAKREGQYVERNTEPLSIFFKASPQTKPDRGKQSAGMSVEDELQSLREIEDYEVDKDPGAVSSSIVRRSEIQRRGTTPPSQPGRRSKLESKPLEQKRSLTPPPSSSVQTSDVKEGSAPDIEVVKDLLKSLRTARATTTVEKIAVLDIRDKLLKHLRGRQQANLASAKAFVGTCPDMCPEKERYYREDIRRLALYEVILSTMSTVVGQKTKVDHCKAVKEYSRSSADQEEPLPLELRPLPVLFATMVYLLREVADLGGEGKWSEWYDFLWNRTRGIRKDITQQQLCTQEVAELLEKCSRFHIFCSERLCEEDMMSFDHKINNENLTKCLQTLKELYADLETKQGIFCPNEAEFRGYMALMKLNEGDTLREVQQLRPEMRESSPIKFAVRAHNSLNNNNYVRFFRLIEQTTFLNGCILHRYFNQIRSRALRTVKRAYRGTMSKYPVQEMIRLLKFENLQQVIDFCSYYGVEVDGSDLVLDSRTFVEPETSLPHSRSPSLVESKQTLTVGETIYGGPLPNLQLPPPVSSFDEEGAFIFSTEFQQTLALAGQKFPSQTGVNVTHSPQKLTLATSVPKVMYSNEAIKSAARTLIVTETDAETLSIAREAIQEEKVRMAGIALWLRDMISDCADEEIRSLTEDVIVSEEASLRQKIESDRQEQRQLAIEALCSEILTEVQRQTVSEIAMEEMSYVKKELHAQLKERCTHACAGDLLETVVDEVIEDIASDVYEVDVVARQEQLKENKRLVQLMRVSRWFRIWRDNQLRSVRVRRAMLDFPAAPPSSTHMEQISALVPVRPNERILKSAFYIGQRTRLNVQSPMDVFRQELHLSAHLSMASAQQMLFNIRMWQPMDVVHCVGTQILRAAQQWMREDSDVTNHVSIQWKLLLSLPKEKYDSSEIERKFIHWMKARLSHKPGKSQTETAPLYEGEILSQYTVQLSERPKSLSKKSGHSALSFCLRCFHSAWNDLQLPNIKKKSLLKGTSGIIFVTQTAEQLTEQKDLWKKEQKRLHQLFTERVQKPALPLVVIVPRRTSSSVVGLDDLKAFLKLEELHKAGLLAAVHNSQPLVDTGDVYSDVNTDWAPQLTSCMRYLATHIPSPPSPLRVKNISDFVEDVVVEFYTAPVYQDLRTRNNHQMLHQSPNVLITLYNDVIEHVAMASSSDSLTKFSWPAPEFDSPKSELTSDWNSESHLADVYELITKLRLPTFRYSNREKDDWATLCHDVWSYMNALTKKDSGSAKICLFQQITELLQSTKKHFDQFCWLASEDGPCEPSYVNMAWTDFIDACIHYRLVSLRTGHLSIEIPEKDDETDAQEEEVKELLVYYHEEEIQDWEAPLSWEEALHDTDSLKLGQVKATVDRAAARRDESMMNLSHRSMDESESSSLSKTTDTSTMSTANATTVVDTTENQSEASVNVVDSWTQLRAQLENERKESERLEQILTSSLKSTPEGRLSSLGSLNNMFTDPKSSENKISSTLKRQRSASDDDIDEKEISTASSHLVTPRSDLPKSRFEKFRRVESPGDEENKTSGCASDFEANLRETLSSDSLSTRLENLRRELEEERRKDKLFEMKMANWLATHQT